MSQLCIITYVFGELGDAMRVVMAAFCLGAALGIVLVANATPAAAQGTQAQQDNCMSDAFRLCAELIPDPIRIEACLKAKRRSLSPSCRREVFGDVPGGPRQVKSVIPDGR